MTRVIITSGKVYYDLRQARDKANAKVSILRLEQFYPFPQAMLAAALNQYPGATELVWVQEEPRNMGAWPVLHERLESLLTAEQKLHYVGNPLAAAPARGAHHRHDDQPKRWWSGL